MQSNLLGGLHVAIIMDGNGRWARQRALPRIAGHRAGVTAVRRTIEAAPRLGVRMITLFAFSCDNWRRPAEEVQALMWLMREFLPRATERALADRVRLSFIGRRDRLPSTLIDGIEQAEAATLGGSQLHVRIALDYSSRDAIATATPRSGHGGGLREAIDTALTGRDRAGSVDLLIRTGGEKRLSDFLLWESAYAELWFTDTMWPDFDAATLQRAVQDFRSRERRFGGLPETVPAPAVPRKGRHFTSSVPTA